MVYYKLPDVVFIYSHLSVLSQGGCLYANLASKLLRSPVSTFHLLIMKETDKLTVATCKRTDREKELTTNIKKVFAVSCLSQ